MKNNRRFIFQDSGFDLMSTCNFYCEQRYNWPPHYKIENKNKHSITISLLYFKTYLRLLYLKRRWRKGYFTFLVARKRVLCYWFIRFEFRFMSHASVRCKLSPISSAIRSRIWGGFGTVQWAIFYSFVLPKSILTNPVF